MRKLFPLLLAGIASVASIEPASAAPSPELIAKVSAAVDADARRLTAIFKDLH